MSAQLSLGRIILGLISWIIPVLAMSRYQKGKPGFERSTFSVLSFSACLLSLILQFFEIKHRVALHDWSALMDTIGALCSVAIFLVIITVALNVLALAMQKAFRTE